MTLEERMGRVRLVLLDVDGVLTDGRLHYGEAGDHGRSFHVRDGSAIKLAQAGGLEVGILSGRTIGAVARRAGELGMTEVHQGRRLKEPAWEEILARRGLEDQHVAFMGDDYLDVALLRRAGLAAVPADAAAEALACAHFVATRPGGAGCVRELLEAILRSRGQWDDLVRRELSR